MFFPIKFSVQFFVVTDGFFSDNMFNSFIMSPPVLFFFWTLMQETIWEFWAIYIKKKINTRARSQQST